MPFRLIPSIPDPVKSTPPAKSHEGGRSEKGKMVSVERRVKRAGTVVALVALSSLACLALLGVVSWGAASPSALLQTQGDSDGYGSTYWGNTLFSRFANEPARLAGSSHAASAPTSMLEESGKKMGGLAQRNRLMKKLKGELASRLRAAPQRPPAKLKALRQPKVYGKVQFPHPSLPFPLHTHIPHTLMFRSLMEIPSSSPM